MCVYVCILCFGILYEFYTNASSPLTHTPLITTHTDIIKGFHTQAAKRNRGPLEQAKARAEKGLEWAPRIKEGVNELVARLTAERHEEETQDPNGKGKKRKYAQAGASSSSGGASSSAASSSTTSSEDDDNEDEVDRLEGEVERLMGDIRDKDTSLKALEADVGTLGEEKAALEAANKKLEEEKAALLRELAEVLAGNTLVVEQRDRLVVLKGAKEREIFGLKNDKEALQSRVAELSLWYKSWRTRVG